MGAVIPLWQKLPGGHDKGIVMPLLGQYPPAVQEVIVVMLLEGQKLPGEHSVGAIMPLDGQ